MFAKTCNFMSGCLNPLFREVMHACQNNHVESTWDVLLNIILSDPKCNFSSKLFWNAGKRPTLIWRLHIYIRYFAKDKVNTRHIEINYYTWAICEDKLALPHKFFIIKVSKQLTIPCSWTGGIFLHLFNVWFTITTLA